MDTTQKATYKLVYNRTNKLNKLGKAPIYIEVYFQRKFRKYINTSIYIEPKDWDAKHNSIHKKYINYINATRLINNKINQIEEYEYNLINKNILFTPKKLDNFLNKNKESETNDFLIFYKNSIDFSNRIQNNTRKEHSYTYHLLCEFKDKIPFYEINYELIDNFDFFMRNDKGLAQNTIHKHHQHFKRFLKIAINKGLFKQQDNPYNNFSSKKVKSDRVNISANELKKLEDLRIGDSYKELNEIKDMFLFSCFCGLRFSDVQQLSKKHIIYK